MTLNNLNSTRVSFFNKSFAILILLIYLLPIIFNWGNSQMRIHDQLDSYNVFEGLVNSGKVFQTGKNVVIENIMNGLPRDCFPSGYNMVIWLIMLFGATGGFFVNYILVHLIGFVGMLLFLNNVINKKDEYSMNWLVAAAFAILPVNNLAGISLMGIPLVFYTFNNLFLKKKIVLMFGLILFYCVYSSLIHTGMFVMFTVGIAFLILLYNRTANIYFFSGMLMMAASYAFIESNLIHSLVFSSEYISHRKEFSPLLTLNFNGVIGVTLLNITQGNYGSANYLGWPVIALAIGILVYSLLKKESNRLLLIGLCIVFSLGFFITVLDWKGMTPVYNKFHFLESFNLRRFHFLLPVGVFTLLSLCITYLIAKNKLFIIPCISFFAFFSVYNFYLNKKYNSNPGNVTFNQFFSKKLFNEIDTYINEPKQNYRIINIGIEPTPAQCYGFYTLDSYQNNYPLKYKNEFRKVIEGELIKNQKTQKYFDEWGNRCYVSANIESCETNTSCIKNLAINITAFKEMGGKYVFSTAMINNAAELNLQFKKEFFSLESNYVIYLYQAL